MPETSVDSMIDGLNTVDWRSLLLVWGERGLRLLIIAVLTWAAVGLLRRLLPRMMRAAIVREPYRSEADALQRYETLTSVLLTTAQVVLVGIAVLMALQEIGFAIAPLVAGLSVAGVAIGFGAQSLVRDVVSGLFILAEDQYRKGDIVQIAGLRGTVEEVNLRRTVLRDSDGAVHSIPNGSIAISSNFTREWARATVDLRLRYTADLDRARAIVDKVGQEMVLDPEVHQALIAAPHWERVEALEDAAVVVRVTATVHPRRQAEVAGELTLRLLEALIAEGLLASAGVKAEKAME